MDIVVCGVDCAMEYDTVFAVVDGVIVDLTCILVESFSTTNDTVGAVDDTVLKDNMSFTVGFDTFRTVGYRVVPHGVIVGSAFIEDLDTYAAAANGVRVDIVEI